MLYYAYGNALLTAEEVFEPSVFEPLTKFFRDVGGGGQPGVLELPSGPLTADNVLKDNKFGADTIPWMPIGTGKPLTLMISETYTGKFPKGNLFKKTEDMIVTSAVKSVIMPDAKPRALNMLKKNVGQKTRPEPGATEKGGPLIFHSPALLEASLTLDLTMAFDTFDQQVFDQFGGALGEIAGVPLFATQSFYLIAGSIIMKLAGRLGEVIFDSTPEFHASDVLNISLPGRPALPAGYLLITSEDLGPAESQFRKDHHVSESGRLVNSKGEDYDGPVPYIIITADGTPREEFKNFTPTAVSAAVISRFFNIKEDETLPVSILIDALKLYNDIRYRTNIDALDDQIKGLKDDDPKKKELQEKRKALLENILEAKLRPTP